jgi:hypothetical protein
MLGLREQNRDSAVENNPIALEKSWIEVANCLVRAC